MWTHDNARVWAILAPRGVANGSKGRGFDRSLAALLGLGLEHLDDRLLEMGLCFFSDASRLGARQVMGLGVLIEGSPLVGEIS